MVLRDDVKELQTLRYELERQKRLAFLRKVLKVFLIGFLIGRGVDRRISAIRKRYDELVKRFQKYFSEIEGLLGSLEKLKGVDAFAARLDEKDLRARLVSLRQDFRFLATSEARDALASIGKASIGNLDRIVSAGIEEYLIQKSNTIREQVERIKGSGTYLICSEKETVLDAIRILEEDLRHFRLNSVPLEVCGRASGLVERYRNVVSGYNTEFVRHRKKEYGSLFRNDYFELDEEQKNAVVADDKYNLVVAGAGAGKTEVLITRIAYLIKRKPDSVLPNHILAIAYQNKDVRQIENRLRERYSIEGVEVKTFHKLGKEILQKSGRKLDRNSIVDDNKKHEIIKDLYEERRRSDPEFHKLFLRYVKVLHDDKKATVFADKAETLEYAKERAYSSINNTLVKSRAEKEIMDFFLMNKLNDESILVDYEPDLPGFKPDFGLPKYDLFIEHWALNKKGEVPKWFDKTTKDYKEEMRFKKEWFARNNKLLVETHSYEYDEANPGPFLELLKNRVIEKLMIRHEGSYEFQPLSYDELVKVAWGPYRDPVDEIANFITNAKTYGLSPAKIAEKLERDKWSEKQVAFGSLAVRVFKDYQDGLIRNGRIDFEDMINDAVVELEKDKSLFSNVYDSILIDEYQDISAQRYMLIKSLIEHNPNSRLFCVGDDWQSIMGFSGSNVDFFVNFERYFGNPAVTKVSTNYRCVKTIVDASADLIRRNRFQISKISLSSRDEERLIRVLRSPHKEDYKRNYYEQTAEDCLDRISSLRRSGVALGEILVLSRFMRTKAHGAVMYHPAIRMLRDKAREKGIEMCDDARDESRVRVLSVHKSKGLEARVVFVLNVIKDAYGFPCEIEDNSIYALARENYPEQDLREEERRLFYVAMTRAKEDLILYTWEPSKSEFLEEIGNYTQEQRLTY